MNALPDAPWIRMAATARIEIKRAYYGDKAEILHRLSRENGVSDGMLRKCLTSLQVLEKLDEDGHAYPRIIRTLQASVIEIFGRWIKHDYANAVDAVEAHARGETTFRELLEKETAARRRSRAQLPRKIKTQEHTPFLPASLPTMIDRAKLKNIIIEMIASDDERIPAQSLAMVGQILTHRSIEPRSEDMFKVKGTWG